MLFMLFMLSVVLFLPVGLFFGLIGNKSSNKFWLGFWILSCAVCHLFNFFLYFFFRLLYRNLVFLVLLLVCVSKGFSLRSSLRLCFHWFCLDWYCIFSWFWVFFILFSVLSRSFLSNMHFFCFLFFFSLLLQSFFDFRLNGLSFQLLLSHLNL